MSDWIDAVVEDIVLGREPLEAIAQVHLEDPREQWYCRALGMLLRARNDPDTDPGRMLNFLRNLGYPIEDLLHVAILFETLLIAIAVHSAFEQPDNEQIESWSEELIHGVEDYLKSH